jgi:hypothetical protein
MHSRIMSIFASLRQADGIAGVDAVCELLMAHGEPFLSGPTVLHTPFQDS